MPILSRNREVARWTIHLPCLQRHRKIPRKNKLGIDWRSEPSLSQRRALAISIASPRQLVVSKGTFSQSTSSKCLIMSVTSWQKSYKSFNNLHNNICMICLDLKDFSPQATKYQRFRILRNLSYKKTSWKTSNRLMLLFDWTESFFQLYWITVPSTFL